VIDISIVIRTLNEGKYLGELMEAIDAQDVEALSVETVLVDSGSTDNTLAIAQEFGCVIQHISRDEFSFGRSLNIGCAASRGAFIVIVSGHCVPTNTSWLKELLRPLQDVQAGYVYGRQVGRDTTKHSEMQVFERYYPATDIVKEPGDFFCNNANSAILRPVWEQYKFDEELTGLEDLMLAKSYVSDGGAVMYVPNAVVYHIHDETLRQVKIRYEREAIALQQIYPQIHFSFFDLIRYVTTSLLSDWASALSKRRLKKEFFPSIAFRCMQYWGTRVGNNNHRILSGQLKQNYFYPNHKEVNGIEEKSSRSPANEGT
jgi:rhamnosyltransferase